MALIIKADMPKDCTNCEFAYYDDDEYEMWCKCGEHRIHDYYISHTKPNHCPILGEIPDEHGRLVDLDAFLEARKNMAEWEEYLIEDIDNYFENPSVVVVEASR